MRPKFVSIQVATARGVADRWASQYHHPKDGWQKTAFGDSKDIHGRLCDLGPNPPIDKAAEIIGNKSWSYLSCDGCGDYVERVVRLGREYDDGHIFCSTCIGEAAQILNGESK